MKRRHFLQVSTASLAVSTMPALAKPKKVAPLISVPAELADNPLLTFGQLPNYPAITHAHIEPAIAFVMEQSKAKIIELCEQKSLTWDNFYRPMEELRAHRDYSWGIVSNLNSLQNTSDFRKVYDAARKVRRTFTSWYSANEMIYACFKALKNSKEYARYSNTQKRALEEELYGFERAGIGLSKDIQEQLTKINDRISSLRTKFSHNVMDASKQAIVIENESELKGMLTADLEAAAKSASKAGVTGYRFTLSDADYQAIMDNVENRALREKFYKAYMTQASDQSEDGKYDNLPIIEEILALQYERANLLGYKNYAEYALVDRMANNPAEVMAFYDGLISTVRQKAKAQNDALIAYGRDKLGIDNPQVWDLPYITAKQKAELYDFDEEALRPYFPLDKALSGVFEVNRRLFGIRVKERKNVPVWHDSVRFFDVFDEKGKHIGSTYVDLYVREGKKDGAWKSTFIDQRKDTLGNHVKPVTVLVANFKQTDGVTLLTHSEVLTLLHEFGHVVHEIISRVDVVAITGTAVPKDVVEFPSQLMEFWGWHKDALALFSGHYKTGEPLPAELVKKAAAAKNYLLARQVMRQIEYGLIDMRLYNEYRPDEKGFVMQVVNDVRQNISVLNEPEYVRRLNAFSHIFGGSYAAAYYGYLWSEVLSADVFARFEKVGIFDRKTGKAFVDKFLSKGGSEDVMKMYVDFMGAKPKPHAFMKQLG